MPPKKPSPIPAIAADDPELIAKLRLVTHPPKKKAILLDGLSDEQLVQVYTMLSNGHEKRRIAKIMQETWGRFPTHSQKGIESALGKFAVATIGHRRDFVHKTKGRRSSGEKRALERIRKQERLIRAKLDEIKELGNLIFDLKDEFELWRETARSQGQPLKYVSDTARLILDALDRYVDLRQKLGLLDIRPKQIDVNVRQASILLHQTVEQPDQITDLLSSFKTELELIAGPVPDASEPETAEKAIDIETDLLTEVCQPRTSDSIIDEISDSEWIEPQRPPDS
ncbi:MAG: hypothetical protein HY913_04250 [Desulfomonile tiedjei]|nr:hypothetical protein [Desulfomonile tiedjei]